MVEPMGLWSASPLVAVPSLSLVSASVRYEAKKNDEDEATAYAIARIASVATKSFEQRRGAQTETLTVLQQAQVLGVLPAALLECDVQSAVGDVVLNERHWWADRSDNAAWKTKKRQIAMRVVRGALQDVAVHLLNWMAPLAKKITETMKPQDRKLSLLVDEWPKGLADVTSAAGEEAVAWRGTSDREPQEKVFDSYIILVWAMLRGICKRDEMPWPTGWGTTSCPCWSLRSLVDAVVDSCMDKLEALVLHRAEGLPVLPEDVMTVLLGGDDTATRWLKAALFKSVVLIRSDMAIVEVWAAQHLLLLIQDHELTGAPEDRGAVVPGPFPGSFLVDGVDVATAEKISTAFSASPMVVELEIPSDSNIKTKPSRSHVGLELLMSQLTKNLAEECKPTRVIVDVEAITVPVDSVGCAPDGWRYNAPVQVMGCVAIEATAVICIQQANVSEPELEIQLQATPSSSCTSSYIGRAGGSVITPAFPGRAMVLPSGTQYRVSATKLEDTTKPGSVSVLRIAFVSPTCTISTSAMEAMLQQSPEMPEWLESQTLKVRDENLSAEEARFAHYQRHQHSDSFNAVGVASSLPIQPPERPALQLIEPLELKVLTSAAVNAIADRNMERLQDTSRGVVSRVEGTWIVDGAVAQEVQAELVSLLQPLRTKAIANNEDGAVVRRVVEPKCYKPAANQTVPTFSVPRIGSVEQRLDAIVVQSVNSQTRFGDPYGGNQWIPSEVAIGLDGSAQFLTYISNVSPREHARIYESIASVTTAFVPFFETLLATMEGPKRVALRGRVVQMVVEVVELELDESNPRYQKDEWRKNSVRKSRIASRKDIIATGLYFATVDNVTTPRLRFRRPVSFQNPNVVNDFVDGQADRCLVLRHELKHTIEPFERIDTSKPGTVLMVKIHLVDPKVPTISTANVRPWQREWTVDFTLGQLTRFFNLPPEVHDVIESMLHWDGTIEESRSIASLAHNFAVDAIPDPRRLTAVDNAIGNALTNPTSGFAFSFGSNLATSAMPRAPPSRVAPSSSVGFHFTFSTT